MLVDIRTARELALAEAAEVLFQALSQNCEK